MRDERRPTFEWDARKDASNQEKRGVSFAQAQYAFADPDRIILQDVSHSRSEKRYYTGCIPEC